MNNNPIGILDSGIGGLSVWKELIRELPQESTIYLADSINVPYGEKSPETIYLLARRLVAFLISQNVKLIVVACNTITVSCLDQLRRDYPALAMIGTVPVVKTAAAVSRNKKIGILSTTRTAASEYQKELIRKFAADCQVTSVGTDELVPFIEKGVIEGKEMVEVLERVLEPFKVGECDAIALGCTHFPFVKPSIQKVLGPDVLLLEPSGAIARHTRRILTTNYSLWSNKTPPFHQFFTTGNASDFRRIQEKVLLRDAKKVDDIVQISI